MGRKRETGNRLARLLESLGARLTPTDTYSRRFLVLQRGLDRLAGRDPRPLTSAQKRELADHRRQLRRAGEPVPRALVEWSAKETALSKRKPKTPDLADMAEKAMKKNPDLRVLWIPNDPTKLHKKFGSLSSFRKFVRRPYYKSALREEYRDGRFVLGEIDEETEDIRRDKKGKPIVVQELAIIRDTRKVQIVKPKKQGGKNVKRKPKKAKVSVPPKGGKRRGKPRK